MSNASIFGAMLDMSRNAVMKTEKVKEYIDYLKAFGYNALLLYTEDTFEVDGEPYFGYLRGRYSKEDIKEIDAYCRKKGVELIPCVQTLAHLNAIFKWKTYGETVRDTDDILLIDAPKTYELIEHIFATLAECFFSRRVHIGMDEAHNMGLGEYLKRHGLVNRFSLMKRHLEKVIGIAKKYGFEPVMWSDMFFRLLNGGAYHGRAPVTEELKESVPQGVGLVYWDYYTGDKNELDFMVKQHKALSDNVWFAGGAWCWCGFAPDNAKTENTMLPAMDVMRENDIENIVITCWGDDGRECSPFAMLPMLYRIRRAYDGVTELEQIKKEFFDLVREDYDAMLTLELPNRIFDTDRSCDKTKYLLYGDLFNCCYDDRFAGGEKKKCLKAAKQLLSYAAGSKFSYLFETEAQLLKILAYKYDLPHRIRAAYRAKDLKELTRLERETCKVIGNVKRVYKLFRRLWFSENHPSGFDVQDIRLGGLIARLGACKERLHEYCAGNITAIEELEEELLPENAVGHTFTYWGKIVSSNVLTNGFI